MIFHHLELMVEPFFSYQKRQFSSSIHPTRLRSFLLTAVYQSIIFIARFFLLNHALGWEVFSLTISSTLPYLSYRARRFFASKKYWFPSLFVCRVWRFFFPSCKVAFKTINRLSEFTPRKKAIITPWSRNLVCDLTCDPPTSSLISKQILSSLLSKLVIIDLPP